MARILLVDDDATVRELLRRCLAPIGYEIIEAESAEAAVELTRSQPPDVAFCDMHMTGANGLWFADQIRALSPTTALVLATGDTRLPAAETLRSGVVAYLLKPLSLKRVVAAAAEGVAWSQRATAQGRRRSVRNQPGPGDGVD